MKDIIFNGVPWFDQNGNTVNAHGACIVRENDTYYLFGEYKTDDKNVYNGFFVLFFNKSGGLEI